MRRRRVLRAIGAATAVGAVAGCAGSGASEPAFQVSSPALEDGGELPTRFSCDGAGDSPPFVVERTPEAVETFAVVGQFDLGVINNPVFWTLWNVPGDTEEIPAGLPRDPTLDSLGGARQGRQPGVEVGYDPVCPPSGESATHWFEVYALDGDLSLDGGAAHEDAVDAVEAEAVASSRVTLTYARSSDATRAGSTPEA